MESILGVQLESTLLIHTLGLAVTVSIGDGNKEINVTRVTCGPGHGISVGSLGRYQNEEPASPSDGIASDMHFDDIIMVNVSNPVLIDQQYCPWNQCKQNVPCENVELVDIDVTYGNKGPLTAQCSNVKPTITRVPRALACATSAYVIRTEKYKCIDLPKYIACVKEQNTFTGSSLSRYCISFYFLFLAYGHSYNNSRAFVLPSQSLLNLITHQKYNLKFMS